MIIGITGGIATGKSSVANFLINKGYIVIDSDSVVHELLTRDYIIEDILKEFGAQVINQGVIDRKALGRIIFNNKDKRLKLNQIIHPKVISRIKDEIKENKDLKDDLIFIDIPLLFEERLEYLVDKIIVVYVPKDIQLARVMKRDNIDEGYALKKIEAAMDIELKVDKGDYLIDSRYDFEVTHQQIEEILGRIKNEI